MNNTNSNSNDQFWPQAQQVRDTSVSPDVQGFQGSSSPALAPYQPDMTSSTFPNQGPPPAGSSAFPNQGPPSIAELYLPEQNPTLPHSLPVGGEPANKPSFKGKLNNRNVLIGVGVLLLLILGGVFFILKGLMSSPDVTLYQVGVQNANQSVGGGGIVFPLQQLNISYPVAERVVSVQVKPGDMVTRNQPLIGLDPAQLDIQVKQASDALDAASVFLQSVQASGNPVSVAQAQQQYNLAKSRYDALVAQTASPLLKNANIISPMDGVVTSVNINPGEVFNANVPLITIMDESSIIVRVKVPLVNFNQVHIGQSATVTPSALPNLNVTGTVISIIPQADAQTDTFEVWVQVKNPDKSILPGMSAFVRIESQDKAVAIPRIAVLDPMNESNVFVVNREVAYMKHVHIIGRSIDMVYVDNGISKGDKVVLIGINGLKDGQQVRVSKTVN